MGVSFLLLLGGEVMAASLPTKGTRQKELIMNGSKPIYVSKTFWFNIIVLGLAVAGALGFKEFVPSEDVTEQAGMLSALVVAAVPVVNIILRFATDTKVTLTK